MSDYQAAVQTLEAELARVEQAFRGLTESDWRPPRCCSRSMRTCRTGPCSSWPATSTSRSA